MSIADKVMWLGLVPKLVGTGRPGRTVDEWTASNIRLFDEQERVIPVSAVIKDVLHPLAEAIRTMSEEDGLKLADRIQAELRAIEQEQET